MFGATLLLLRLRHFALTVVALVALLLPRADAGSDICGVSFDNSTNSGLLFVVELDYNNVGEFDVKWGHIKTQYVLPQSAVTPGIIYTEEDMLCWYSSDRKGHWFDMDELEEINYFGPPYEIDVDMIAWADQWGGRSLWVVSRNQQGTVDISVLQQNNNLQHLLTVAVSGDNVLVADDFSNMIIWTDNDGFTFIDKNRTSLGRSETAADQMGEKVPQLSARPLSHDCVGTPVALSSPWGWPTNDSLYVVVTRVEPNATSIRGSSPSDSDEVVFHASRYDTNNGICRVGYTFHIDQKYLHGTTDDPLVFQWMDAFHALVIKSHDHLIAALPGQGPAAPTKVIDVTSKLKAHPSTIVAMASWPY